MRNAVKATAVLLAICLAGWIVWTRLLAEVPSAASPPETPPDPGLAEPTRRMLAETGEATAAQVFRETLGTALTPAARLEVEEMLRNRAARAAERGRAEVEQALTRFRYREAADHARRVQREWRGTQADRVMAELLEEIDQEQRALVEARRAEALELHDLDRTDAAREALRTEWELEEAHRQQLLRYARELEGRIRARSVPGTGPRPVATTPAVAARPGEPSPPPGVPGLPHPDVKRLRDARATMKESRSLFSNRRYQPAATALRQLTEYYGDLLLVQRNLEAIHAMNALARHAARGLPGLFNAASMRRDGRRVRLRYDFASDEQLRDWEEVSTIPIKDTGRFEKTRDGIRGTGAAGFLSHTFFRNDVKLRCRAYPEAPRTHGLGFCQAGLETRQILLIVTNHWFVEGENYVKKRPGHSLLFLGKGTNADVPIDSPEIGFLFKGDSIEQPKPGPGEEVKLSFALEGTRMSGEVTAGRVRGVLRREAVGDDGRSIERVRPLLFVLQAGVVFRQIEIDGTLHPSFESERISQLLTIAETLERS